MEKLPVSEQFADESQTLNFRRSTGSTAVMISAILFLARGRLDWVMPQSVAL
jgi:hypothetical protein